MAKIDWYEEFVDLDYEPAKDELVALFYFEPPRGMSKEESAGRIASESSTGTWTTLTKLPDRMKGLQATAFDIQGNYLKVAYPGELWEPGNFCQFRVRPHHPFRTPDSTGRYRHRRTGQRYGDSHPHTRDDDPRLGPERADRSQ